MKLASYGAQRLVNFGGHCAVAAVLLFASVAYAVTPRPAQMPWTTFSEMLKAETTSNMAGCPQGPILVTQIKYKDAAYIMLLTSNPSGIVVFAYDQAPDSDAPYTDIGIGVLDSANADKIPALQWEPFVEAKHRNICPRLFPEQT
jgi:hypothetical protein